VLVDGESIGDVDSYTFHNVTSDHTIEAVFAAQTHTITARAWFGDLQIDGFVICSGGFTQDDPASAKFFVAHGETVTFETKEAHPEFLVQRVQIDGVAQPKVEKSYTFKNVTEDHTVDLVLNDVVQTSDGGSGGGGSGFGCFISALGATGERTVTREPTRWDPSWMPRMTGEVILCLLCALGIFAVGSHTWWHEWRRGIARGVSSRGQTGDMGATGTGERRCGDAARAGLSSRPQGLLAQTGLFNNPRRIGK
jgi:hypothetical protein